MSIYITVLLAWIFLVMLMMKGLGVIPFIIFGVVLFFASTNAWRREKSLFAYEAVQRMAEYREQRKQKQEDSQESDEQ